MGSSHADTARDLRAVPSEALGIAKTSMQKEHPQHSVAIERPFAVGKRHVTRREFATFIDETKHQMGSETCTVWVNHRFLNPPSMSWLNPGFSQTDDDPVVCVSWEDAQQYVSWLNRKSREGNPQSPTLDGPYRLPTEAEWEYSARGGTETARWWGNDIGSQSANCDGCGSRWDKRLTAPTGSFPANPFGLYDVLGNAWQWLEDCWNPDYSDAPRDQRARDSGACEERVAKGGGWMSQPWVLRSAHRNSFTPNRRYNYIGFRVAKTLHAAPTR